MSIACSLLLVASFASTPFASAASGQPLASAAQGASNSSGSTASQLQTEIDALNAMTDALGPMAEGAEERIRQMKAFVTEQKLDAALATFTAGAPGSGFSSLTFSQAFQTALDAQRLRGPATPTSDVGALETEFSATQTLVQAQWTRVNGFHTQVASLTAFLQQQGKLDAYHDWAATAAGQRAAQPAAKSPPTDRAAEDATLTPEQRQANIQRYQAQLARLRQNWDEEQHTGQSSAYQPSQNRGGSANGGPSQNQAGNSDYYGGSYWNGYADPYYDVWGYGAGARPAARAAAWNRAGGGGGFRGVR
jgi:hypothetical protein